MVSRVEAGKDDTDHNNSDSDPKIMSLSEVLEPLGTTLYEKPSI
jgi:hypothetical protein